MNVAILGLARGLASRGIEVDLLTRATASPAVTVLEPGVTLHELPAGAPGVVDKNALPTLADDFGEAVAQLAQSTPYDIVHAHYWLSGIAALPVALELSIPFVQSFHTLAEMKRHSMPTGTSTESIRRVRSETFLAIQADAVVASSTAEVAHLIESVGADTERVWIVPPGVDPEVFAPRAEAAAAVRARLEIGARRPILAVVGRVQQLKGQRLAVRVLAALVNEPGPPVGARPRPVLVIAGEPTPGDEAYFAGLLELAQQLGVAADLRFTGALDREGVAELLAAAAVTLVPSHSETFGLVALESAACGTPVVAQRVSGLTESVSDGESGLLIDSRDPVEWARAVELLIADDRFAADMARTARAHAEGFDWSTTVSVLLDVYRSLVRV
ncbi:MAG: hypothetical protein JWM51_951 [Microbacteriaceae bacterium]|nr:hypothetical protein [Microbacteriaceae bacterium]